MRFSLTVRGKDDNVDRLLISVLFDGVDVEMELVRLGLVEWQESAGP